MEPVGVLSTSSRQPVPAEPISALDDPTLPAPEELEVAPRTEYVGRLRLPIAGPYRPWARLYRLPDGRVVWTVRLWESDRVVHRLASTATLLGFARVNGLAALAARIRALDRRGRGDA